LEDGVQSSAWEGVSLLRYQTARLCSGIIRAGLAYGVIALLFVIFPACTRGQSNATATTRQVKVVVKPEYSALAKRLNLIGSVKVEVTVAPDGKVKKAHVLGGHPVLAVEAEKAALMTEFEAGPKETLQVLEFHFGSSN
jgi:Gram-negative bacterial TonB protein C-terminal